MKKLYVSYGLMMSKRVMAHHCSGARPIAKSWIFDYRLVFQGKRYDARLTLEPEKDHDVPVVVWEITDKHEAELDKAVAVLGNYVARLVNVEVAGEMRLCKIHVLEPANYGIPSEIYLDSLKEGYTDFNLDTSVLTDALLHGYRNIGMPPANRPNTKRRKNHGDKIQPLY